jgi:HK97 family phage major capsid protein
MGTYNSLVSATDAAALIPEDAAREIIKGATVKSAAMSLFKHRTMSRAQQRLPVLALKPTAYFVSGRTGLKQTSEVNWTNKYLDAEEIAVIVPVPESLIADVDYDLWGEIKPEIEEAIAVCLDDAIFFGTNKPESWPTDIAAACAAASNTVTYAADSTDIATNLSQMMDAVEADGYDVNGFWCHVAVKGLLRGLRTTAGDFIFLPNGNAALGSTPTVFGEKAIFSKAAFTEMGTGSGGVMAIAGDWNQGIIGIREDITYKVLDQAVLTDDNGAVIFNLAQQDMVALRVTFRAAFQVPNPPNRLNTVEATRYPFATLLHG